MLETNNIILHQISEDINQKFKFTQRQTAKKVLNRFMKKLTFADKECQTVSEEDIMEQLQDQLKTKDSMIK